MGCTRRGIIESAKRSLDTWMTYRQAMELNAQVRKGEHGALVVYADRFTRIQADDQGEDIEREISFMKAYTVFNVEQIEGLPDHYTVKPEPNGETWPTMPPAPT